MSGNFSRVVGQKAQLNTLQPQWTFISLMQAGSRHFKQMLEAIVSLCVGYQPPSCERLRSRLLMGAVDQIYQGCGCCGAKHRVFWQHLHERWLD